MSRLLVSLIFFALIAVIEPARGEDSLLGIWQYDGFIFDGHRYPNPNPDLILRFTFQADGVAHLKWLRKNESGFCERRSDFRIHDENSIWQKVTWLNPANASDCGRDPDMQLGKETDNRFSLVDGELRLHFELNGQEFLYVLRRCDSSPTGCPGVNASQSLKAN